MKKVLIIIGKLYIGGAERVGRDIGYYADKTRYEIHYVVFGSEIGAYEEELKLAGCIIHHTDPPSQSYYKYYRFLVKLIKSVKFDVIHSHTMFNSGWVMLAGWTCRVPTRIAHSHTIRGPEKRGFIKIFYESAMRKLIIHTANNLVACGNSAGEWLYGAKVFKKRGEVIYNGIELKEFVYNEKLRNKIRNQYNLQEKFVIGHVGHLAPVKNQTFLLKLMPEILKIRPEALLLLIGDGEDRKRLENLVSQLDLQEKVIMTGNIDNVGEYMNLMDVFVFPSLYEGMPLALVEAQTNGLPCLISDHIPDDSYLTDLVKAIPLEESKDQWISAIASAKRINAMSYGVKMYQLGFDISKMLKQIYCLYEK